ncbi:GNAT family N-acetyltransferase [Nonomuraea sp. NPDC050783]|uniref:GNAT family N-acetyltransferase n=1 Tax=Nonomuraea sp. NPDC050783 TaxID=3154634 RepID=UPI00346639D4
MITIQRADRLGEAHRRAITEVLTRGFAEDFTFFSDDPGKLADAFAHMVIMDRFHVALVDREPAGLASLTTGQEECFAPRWSQLRRHLGAVHGTISHLVVRSQFLGPLPEAREGLAEIGFVATAPAYRSRGVATALLRHLLELPEYDEYVLREVKDNNVPALALYRKLGFTEYRRRPVRFARRAGFSAYVSLRLTQKQ